jgi:lysozyme
MRAIIITSIIFGFAAGMIFANLINEGLPEINNDPPAIDRPAIDRPAIPKPTDQYEERQYTPLEQRISDILLHATNLIKRWEGFSSTPYYCAAGVRTIGYGDTDPQIVSRGYITEEEAEQYLINRIERIRNDVETKISAPISHTQLVALISFYYNLGSSNFDNIAKRINDGRMKEAGDAILLYDKCDGHSLRGLRNRRLEEQYLFNL